MLLIPLIFLGLWAVQMFNTLVRHRNHVMDAWAGIDTELKRRHDLIPTLVATVKGFAAHESRLLEAVTLARTAAMGCLNDPHVRGQVEQDLVSNLHRLLAITESYPELTSSEQFLALQQQLVETEDRIQAARRFYNANVRDYNSNIESVPSNLIASIFNFEPATYFELSSLLEADPQIISL